MYKIIRGQELKLKLSNPQFESIKPQTQHLGCKWMLSNRQAGWRVWQGGRLIRGTMRRLQQGPAHHMVKVIGENKVAVQARATGREASDNELGVITQIR